MQDQVPNVFLPFWDWASTASQQQGIPEAFASATYPLPDGSSSPNRLFSARNEIEQRLTSRNPQDPVVLTSLARQVTLGWGDGVFRDFTGDIEAPHDNLHGWVRGDMGAVQTAAYDPIFWVHHANVDRQWAVWQRMNGDGSVPDALLDAPLDPFGMTFRQVLDFACDLHYEYGPSDTPMPGTVTVPNLAGIFAMGPLPTVQGRVLLHVRGLQMSTETYNVQVFVNQAEADDKTPLAGNPHHAGMFSVFGMGAHVGHMQQRAQAVAHHALIGGHPASANLPPKSQVLDITEAVKKVVPPGQEIHLKLVATTNDGTPVDVRKVPFEGLRIEFQ